MKTWIVQLVVNEVELNYSVGLLNIQLTGFKITASCWRTRCAGNYPPDDWLSGSGWATLLPRLHLLAYSFIPQCDSSCWPSFTKYATVPSSPSSEKRMVLHSFVFSSILPSFSSPVCLTYWVNFLVCWVEWYTDKQTTPTTIFTSLMLLLCSLLPMIITFHDNSYRTLALWRDNVNI